MDLFINKERHVEPLKDSIILFLCLRQCLAPISKFYIAQPMGEIMNNCLLSEGWIGLCHIHEELIHIGCLSVFSKLPADLDFHPSLCVLLPLDGNQVFIFQGYKFHLFLIPLNQCHLTSVSLAVSQEGKHILHCFWKTSSQYFFSCFRFYPMASDHLLLKVITEMESASAFYIDLTGFGQNVP